MPYKVIEEEGEWCVYKHDAEGNPVGKTRGCHPSKGEAEAQMRALYANEKSVKALVDTPDNYRIGGYGVVFAGKDLTGDTFTPLTDFWLTRIPGVRPVLYDHALHDKIKGAVVGTAEFTPDDFGLWVEAELDVHNGYLAFIKPLVEKGALGWSTGSAGHLVEREDNIIKRWPIVEISLTPTPAEPRTLGIHELRSFTESMPELKALMLQADEESAAGASEAEPVGDKSETETSTNGAEGAEVKMDIDYDKIATLVADKMASKEPPVKSAGVAMPEVMTRAEIRPQDCYLAYKTCAKLYPGEGFKNLEKEHQNPLKAYQKSFDKYLHRGERGLEPEDLHLLNAYKAALTEAGGAGGAAAAEGAYWVAAQYLDQLVSAIAQQSYVRMAGARVVPMTALTMYVPKLTFSTFAALAATEEASYDEVEPTAAQVTFTSYKSTRIAKASDELVADAMFDIWTYILMPDFAQAFAANENKYMTTGTGSSQPEGCSYAATTGVTAASSTAITADEVIDTKFALDFKYRPNAKWMAHDSTIKAISKLKDGSGRYLWEPSWQAGQPDRLLGYPVITNSGMEEIAASKKVLLFGDFSYFWIGDREDLTIKRLDELYAASGQIAYRAYKRYDSHIMLAAGSTQLVMKA